MFTRFLISAALAVALLSSAEAQSRRDLRSPGVPPPVVTRAFAVQRGEKITVPLGIHGTRGELLEFLIRTPPAFGKLSPVKSTGMNSATVTYTPSARNSVFEDHFTYAVRGSEGVSAAGVITIRFAETIVAMPKLKAPTELEFPPVFPGQRSTAEMDIANDGGGILEGEVAVPEPWSIEGLKFFKLAAGKSTTFKLVFTPATAGVKTGEAVITGSQRRVVPLRASAEERMEATPMLLKLTAQPGNQTRSGMLKLVNHSEEDANVTLEAGARLLTDRTVKVPARSTSTVPVFADAATGAAFDDTVKLTSREWSVSVNVHAVAVGAILKFSADEVDITGTAADATAGGTAVLENSGGEPLTVRLDVDPPFEIETRVVTAPARGSVEIPILVRNARAGTFRSIMKAVGEGGSAVTQLKAEITAAPDAPATVRTPAPAIEDRPGTTAEDAPRENETALIPQNIREVPNIFGKFARATGTDSATIAWPAALGPVENLRVEERVLSLSGDGELQITWAPLPAAGITSAGGRITAELRGLRAGTFYTVRVVSGSKADSSVLFTADFQTVAKKPVFTSATRTPLLVVALCILLAAIWHSRRAQRQAGK
ncbi:MAG: hypothetical protein ABIP20_18185 [Chthoniobacteraceae bacterium]